MHRVRRHLLVPLSAALLALGGCGDAGGPAALREAAPPALAPMYVLQSVNGQALPARVVQFGQRVYRVHADTLRFDQAALTFREMAAIGGRDTTTADPERIALRDSGALPFTRPDLGSVVLQNFMGLGRSTARLHDDWITVTALGQRYAYLRERDGG